MNIGSIPFIRFIRCMELTPLREIGELATACDQFCDADWPGRGAELPLEKLRRGRNTSWARPECSTKKLHTQIEPSTASSWNLHRPVTRRSPGVYGTSSPGTLIQIRRPVEDCTVHPLHLG